MAETFAQKLLTEISNTLTTKIELAIITNTKQVLHSSLSPSALDVALKIVEVGSSLWDIGDYQMKKLEDSLLLVYKITNHFFLALNSVAKEGLLILEAKKIASTFESKFRELEKELSMASKLEKVKMTSSQENEQPATEKGKEEKIQRILDVF